MAGTVYPEGLGGRSDRKHKQGNRLQTWEDMGQDIALISFLTCVQKHWNLVVLNELVSIFKMPNFLLKIKLFQGVIQTYLHIRKLQNSLTALLSPSPTCCSEAATGPCHPQTGPATELVSTTTNIFFLRHCIPFLLCSVTVFRPVYIFCALFWKTLSQRLDILSSLLQMTAISPAFYQVWCPEHHRKIKIPLWAWLDHITDSLNNIWEPLAKTWPLQVTLSTVICSTCWRTSTSPKTCFNQQHHTLHQDITSLCGGRWSSVLVSALS